MKSSNKLIMTGLVVMVVLNLALLGFLWMDNSKEGKSKQRGTDRNFQPFEKELSLTKEQIEQFKVSRIEYRKQVAEVTKGIFKTRGELYQSLRAGNNEKVDSLVAEIGDAHEQLEILNFEHFTELGSILTDEQRPVFARLIRKMMMSGLGRNMDGGHQMKRKRGN